MAKRPLVVPLFSARQPPAPSALRMVPLSPTTYTTPPPSPQTLQRASRVPLGSVAQVLPPSLVCRMSPPSPTAYTSAAEAPHTPRSRGGSGSGHPLNPSPSSPL